MKVIEFDYTDAKGKKTHRVALALTSPSESYYTIDLQELSQEEQGQFLAEMRKAKEQYDIHVAELMAEYDIKHNFRRFLASNMENIVAETY